MPHASYGVENRRRNGYYGVGTAGPGEIEARGTRSALRGPL